MLSFAAKDAAGGAKTSLMISFYDAGPRRPGEGTEESTQGIVSADLTASG